ncbi:MAG: ATP phosphoribosyltransferase regulatory subunit [Pseudomonadota bacterium]
MSEFKSHTARARIEAMLLELGATLASVDVLQPAEPFLDTAGDELRRRIFMARGVDGRNVCLRPEFTIPVCLQHVHNGLQHTRHGYVGEVFREGRAEGMEFSQAGIEDLGDADRIAADARVIGDALAMVEAMDAGKTAKLTIGDQNVFDAVLKALELPSGWRARLADVFGDGEAMSVQLAALSKPKEMPDLPPAILHALTSRDAEKLSSEIAVALNEAGLSQSGGRTAEEIAKRLMSKHLDTKHAAAPKRVAQLEAFLSIQVPLNDAPSALAGFADAAGIDLHAALTNFEARIEAMAGLDLDRMEYAASFGRALDYYTGLVFEVREDDGTVLVGGGRYDRLLEMLGAENPIPGVGFSIWLDRLNGGAS